jgi:protease-4
VCAALRAAGERDSVAAVVLRVVSPGGSYVASDAIHREVVRLREAGTPVVVSMGSVAASGGYFVAMAADEIVALPSTVTGSIGVLGGKIVVGDALRRLGIGTEPVGSGAQATMFDPTRRFETAEWRRVERWLDAVYDDFTAKAAAGRRLPHEQLEPLARGRVWTGADACERGLVDTLGGLDRAVTSAAERAGTVRERVRVERVPHVGPLERLRPAPSSESAAAGSGAPGTFEELAATALRGLGLPGTGVLSLPGPWRVH